MFIVSMFSTQRKECVDRTAPPLAHCPYLECSGGSTRLYNNTCGCVSVEDRRSGTRNTTACPTATWVNARTALELGERPCCTIFHQLSGPPYHYNLIRCCSVFCCQEMDNCLCAPCVGRDRLLTRFVSDIL